MSPLTTSLRQVADWIDAHGLTDLSVNVLPSGRVSISADTRASIEAVATALGLDGPERLVVDGRDDGEPFVGCVATADLPCGVNVWAHFADYAAYRERVPS